MGRAGPAAGQEIAMEQASHLQKRERSAEVRVDREELLNKVTVTQATIIYLKISRHLT
jgi:hypothetical protein